MSHTVSIDIKFSDEECIAKTCEALELSEPQEVEDYRFYDGTTVSGLSVQLPNWHYPVVFEKSGEAKFDNYGGSWGNQSELNRFSQEYALQVAESELLGEGWMTERTEVDNGDIQLRAFR